MGTGDIHTHIYCLQNSQKYTTRKTVRGGSEGGGGEGEADVKDDGDFEKAIFKE